LTGIKPGGTLPAVNMEFVNREAELRELDGAAKHGGLLVVFGRRPRPARRCTSRSTSSWTGGKTCP
jgi:hypothetical protein